MDKLTLPIDPMLQSGAAETGAQQRLSALQRRLNRGDISDEKELKEACQGFESIFLAKLWQAMRASVPKEGYLHSPQEDQYLSMFDHHLAQKLAENGGIGLGSMLFDQLKDQLVRASEQTGSPEPMPEAEAAELRVAVSGEDEEARVVSQARAQEGQTASSTKGAAVSDEVDRLARHIEKQLGNTASVQDLLQQRGVRQVSAAMPSGLPPMVWPVTGEVSSGFGWRNDPFTNERAWHGGIDVAASEGTPVKSCWPGTVTFAGNDGGYGQTVIISHEGGWESRYAHNRDLQVQVGDKVRAGQYIARVGNTGRSTGPHLHFELRQGSLAWNPRQIEQRLLAGMSIGKQV